MLRLAWKVGRPLWPLIRDLPGRAAVALGSPGFGEEPRPGRLRKAMVIILPITLLAWWALPQVIWVMSPSIDAWAVRPAPGPIHRGDLVAFQLSHPLAGPRPVGVTKYALCLPGDTIEMRERPSRAGGEHDGWYYCNGRLLGISKSLSLKGAGLVHWKPSQAVIPAGYLYVGSKHPSGFDSRYYGLVAIARLTRMERVL
jgi:conjugal transfer pilin signal peptidase TrbI